jgi:hypothetical protein
MRTKQIGIERDGGHSRFSPSSSHRWTKCPGSIVLSERAKPTPPSEYALLGTVAHKIGEVCLFRDKNASQFLGALVGIDDSGRAAILGGGDDQAEPYDRTFLVDDEIVESVQVYLDFIRGIEGIETAEVYIEQTVPIRERDGFVSDFGTVDALVEFAFDRLIIVDYKHGKGVPVEVEENRQLLNYAIGAINVLGDDFETIDLVIVQPRAIHKDGPIRTWSISPGLVQIWKDVFDKAVQDCLDYPDQVVPGDHCKWCGGQTECSAIESETTSLVPTFGEIEKVDASLVSDEYVEKIKLVLDKSDRIQDFLKTIHSEATRLLEAGIEIPGYKLVQKRTNRKWIDEVKVIRRLKSRRFKQKDYLSFKLKPLGQIEKLLGKKTTDQLTTKPDGGTTIAPDNDPRPLVDSAKNDFEGIDPSDFD